jgi:Mrp family chromosome partitioning ATPase
VAVMLGLVAVAVAEYLDDSISTRQDIVKNLHVEYAGGLPDINKLPKVQAQCAPEDYVLDYPFSVYTEAVRNIGAFLKLNRPGASKVTLASSLPREGKTTLAISLARVLAEGHARVLLIDGDLRRCSASQLLVPGASWSDQRARWQGFAGRCTGQG